MSNGGNEMERTSCYARILAAAAVAIFCVSCSSKETPQAGDDGGDGSVAGTGAGSGVEPSGEPSGRSSTEAGSSTGSSTGSRSEGSGDPDYMSDPPMEKPSQSSSTEGSQTPGKDKGKDKDKPKKPITGPSLGGNFSGDEGGWQDVPLAEMPVGNSFVEVLPRGGKTEIGKVELSGSTGIVIDDEAAGGGDQCSGRTLTTERCIVFVKFVGDGTRGGTFSAELSVPFTVVCVSREGANCAAIPEDVVVSEAKPYVRQGTATYPLKGSVSSDDPGGSETGGGTTSGTETGGTGTGGDMPTGGTSGG